MFKTTTKNADFFKLLVKSQLPFIMDKLEEIMEDMESEKDKEKIKKLVDKIYAYDNFNRVHQVEIYGKEI